MRKVKWGMLHHEQPFGVHSKKFCILFFRSLFVKTHTHIYLFIVWISDNNIQYGESRATKIWTVRNRYIWVWKSIRWSEWECEWVSGKVVFMGIEFYQINSRSLSLLTQFQLLNVKVLFLHNEHDEKVKSFSDDFRLTFDISTKLFPQKINIHQNGLAWIPSTASFSN